MFSGEAQGGNFHPIHYYIDACRMGCQKSSDTPPMKVAFGMG